MTLEELKAKLKSSIHDAKADEQRYWKLVRQEGATSMGASANTTSMHLARQKAELIGEILRDLQNLT